MARIQTRRTGWLDRIGWRRPAASRAPLLASRDLPPSPFDPETRLALPRSPAPLPDEALRFMRNARGQDVPMGIMETPPPPDEIAPRQASTGAELRALFVQVEEKLSLRMAIEQAKEAQRRLAERPGASANPTPLLRLVSDRDGPLPAPEPAVELDVKPDVAAALVDALETLRRLSLAARD